MSMQSRFLATILIAIVGACVVDVRRTGASEATPTAIPGQQAHDHEHDRRTVQLDPELAKRVGIAVETAGPAAIEQTLPIFGHIVADESRTVHASARFAGVVRELHKRIGDSVARGETIAVVESNESLQRYDVRATVDGTILRQHAANGESVAEGAALFSLADVSHVWAQFYVPLGDRPKIRLRQQVRVVSLDGRETVTAIDYIAPFADAPTQTLSARAGIANSDGLWRPGESIRAEVVTDQRHVAVAIRPAAIQTIDGREVVFHASESGFDAEPVRIGLRNARWAEVLEGITAGEAYVSENSFLLKAELGKAGAAHEHQH